MSDNRVARFGAVVDAHAQDVAVRLMSRLRVEGECWIWTGYRLDCGYGQIRLGRRMELTHAVAVFLRHGPEALAAETVNHLCFNRACCNPDHLQTASRRENTLHGNGPSAWQAAQTHCMHGHEFTPENTYESRRGRACKACRRNIDRNRTPRNRPPKVTAASIG